MRANLWLTSPLPCRPLALLAAGLAVCALCVPGTADARSYRVAAPRVVEKKEAAKPAPPPGPVLAVVSIAKQRITVYGASGVVGHSPVSSGRPGFATPTGVFTILQKNRFHHSNIYSGAPMPFMQRLTWSGVALHAGALPGFPASHGCIRLPNAFAQELWGITALGGRVVVTPDDAHPVEVAHAALPRPIMTPAPIGAGINETSPIKTAALGDGENGAPPAGPVKLLNPIERAKLMRASTTADAALKAKAAKEAMELSAARAREANKAIAALRMAELKFADARARLAAAAKVVEVARTPEAAERARIAEAAVQDRLDEARRAAEDAAATETTVTAAAFDAAHLAWTAEKLSDAATAAMKSAERAGEQFSIFVSKKTGRIYIRQGGMPVHEAPVAFKDPATPVGTHVYLALEPAGQGPDLRWLSVSMAGANPAPDGRAQYGRRVEKAKVPPPVLSHETAASALERFELDDKTKTFISERLWAGAVLIVSDQGISGETGAHTDFVILTR